MRQAIDEKRRMTAADSGAYFSVVATSVIIVNLLVSSLFIAIFGANDGNNAFYKSDAYSYLSFSLGSIILCAVTAVYLGVAKIDRKSALKLNKATPKYYLFALLALFACVTGLSRLNETFINFLIKHVGYKPVETVLPSLTPLNYCLTVLCVCVLPAAFEEFAFRGVLLGGLDGVKPIPTALVTGFAFSVFHMNPAQTPYQFVVGFTFALLALSSGSVFPSCAAHFLNNFIIINVGYFGAGEIVVPPPVNVLLTVTGLLAFAAFIIICVNDLRKRNVTSENGGMKKFLLYGLAGFALCLIVWVSGLL